MSKNEADSSLTEPLLVQTEAVALPVQDDLLRQPRQEPNEESSSNGACRKTSQNLVVPAASDETNDDDDVNDGNNGSNNNDGPQPFSLKEEMVEMLHLGLPLAVSFFCRMGMASTDSAFVGHIDDGINSPEVYLAAAVLSDMVLNICICPPLAFNQVLNGLVSQAVGSNNPKMAGIWLQQSMFWLATTMLPCCAALFFVEPILKLLGFPDSICAVAGTYAKYNVIWPVPNGLYQCMRFYFQARGLPRPAMYNNIVFLFVNAGLNWLFVFGGPFQWEGLGFIGAAISLSISRTMQGFCYFLYMFVYKKHHIGAWPDEGWSLANHTRERTREFMAQSVPNIGTLLFQSFASQAQTVLVGRLGELPIAASSALSTVTIPWSGTLSATTCMISAIRVGYHLGKGDAVAAKKSSFLVMHFITAVNVVMAVVFLLPLLRNKIMTVATNDDGVIGLAEKLVPAMLVGTYLNLMVGNATSGIFSGQGRPLIATILSFGLELPLSIGGVAVYILVFHGNILGVYWWGAIAAGIEIVIVMYLVLASDWAKCADEARQRQEAGSAGSDDDNDNDDETNDLEDGETSAATTEATTAVDSAISSSDEDGSDADDNNNELRETAAGAAVTDPPGPPAEAAAAAAPSEACAPPDATPAAAATTEPKKKKGGKKKRNKKR